MKHIVLFSGGCASAYVAYLVIKEHGRKDTILLHTPTFSEHPDADRFRCQVARYLKMPITVWGDGRNIWQIIEDNNCLPSQFIPFCTRQLKQRMKEEFYRTLDDEFVEYIGFGMDEWPRVQKATARAEAEGRKVRFPLFEQKVSNWKVKQIIQNEWKIELPSVYKYLEHNNCIPCFKAGKKSWKAYYKHYPEQFRKAVEMEKVIGHTVFKDKSLEELAVEWANDSCQIDLFETTPCECWNT